MDRNSDDPGLVGDSAGDGLANPPSSVGTKLKTFVIIKFFDGSEQACVALLDEVE